MRTRKNPCPADQAWPEGPKSRECRREAAPDGSQLNGLFPEESVDGELRKSRKQRKRKRSPKAKPGRSHPEFLLGMSAENVWFDKPFYDRAEEVYREKLLESRSQIPREYPEALPPCSGGNSHGNLSSCHHVLQGVWLNKPHFDKAERDFMAKSQLSHPSGSGIPAGNDVIPGWERPPENGKPIFSHWEALLVREVWLEKPLYDSAERSFYERLFPGNSRAGNHPGGKRAIPGIPEVFQARFLLHPDSEAAWLQKPSYDRAESRFFSRRDSRAAGIRENPMGIPEDPTGNPSQTATPTPATKKMALDHFLHDKVWLDKHRYDDAERRFYERLNGPLGSPSRLQEVGASTILRDIARARENIQKSLEGQKAPVPAVPAPAAPHSRIRAGIPGGIGVAPSGRSRKQPGRSCSSGGSGDQTELLTRISQLEVENQTLRGAVSELQMAVLRLESRLNALEKSSGSHQPSPVPPTQKVEPFSVPPRKVELPARRSEPSEPSEQDNDDDLDLFGSEDEEQDREALAVREERLRIYAQKKAGKPGIVAKSSILLDVKPWDDETDMGKLEECVRSIHMDGLLWGGSKLVPVGFGIRKLQIQCVVEDEKVGTDILEEEITKFEDYVQSVDIAAFNKI